MDRYQLCLHPAHGNGRSEFAALSCPELAAATSAGERLACLSMMAATYANHLEVGLSGVHDLRVNKEWMVAFSTSGATIFRMPIALSLVAGDAVGQDQAHNFDGPVGVIAYAPRVHAREWMHSAGAWLGLDLGDASSFWIIVVSRGLTFGAREVDSPSRVLLTAMNSLASLGAICGGTLGYQASNRIMGEGGFGRVVLCNPVGVHNDDTTGVASTQLAVKVIGPTTSEEVLMRELACFQAAQPHPNICQYVAVTCNFDDLGNTVWNLVMEAHPRGTLTDLVRRVFRNTRAGIEQKRALSVTRDLTCGLAHMHALGIIHRDVKPDNLLISSTDGRAILIDFGIAVHTSEVSTERGQGTPGFAAPEVLCRKEYGPKVDIFGSGAVLYFALGGVCPFVGRNIKTILRKNICARVKFPSVKFNTTEDDVKKLVKLMMKAKPEHRPDAKAVLAYLRPMDLRCPVFMHAESHDGMIEETMTPVSSVPELAVSSSESESEQKPASTEYGKNARPASMNAVPGEINTETAAKAPMESYAMPGIQVSIMDASRGDSTSYDGPSGKTSLSGSLDGTGLRAAHAGACNERDGRDAGYEIDEDREPVNSFVFPISVKGESRPRAVRDAFCKFFQRKSKNEAKDKDMFMSIITTSRDHKGFPPARAGERSALTRLRLLTCISYFKRI